MKEKMSLLRSIFMDASRFCIPLTLKQLNIWVMVWVRGRLRILIIVGVMVKVKVSFFYSEQIGHRCKQNFCSATKVP